MKGCVFVYVSSSHHHHPHCDHLFKVNPCITRSFLCVFAVPHTTTNTFTLLIIYNDHNKVSRNKEARNEDDIEEDDSNLC